VTKIMPKLGSKAWRVWVWASPPVDKLKGRTLWTQTHQPWMEAVGRHAPVQGRPEYIGLLVLDYLKNLGLVSRYKEHPFATSEDDLGWEIRPDSLAEVADNLCVIEIKTARFVTDEVRAKLDANREGLKKFGLKYLFWTDQTPLQYSVRHNLINMRRAASEDISADLMQGLQELVKKEHFITVELATKQGFDLDSIFAAWWRGYIFLPLTRSVDAQTPIRSHAFEDFRSIFLGEKPILDDWWETLPNV
jgi:hypothetical protein